MGRARKARESGHERGGHGTEGKDKLKECEEEGRDGTGKANTSITQRQIQPHESNMNNYIGKLKDTWQRLRNKKGAKQTHNTNDKKGQSKARVGTLRKVYARTATVTKKGPGERAVR